MLQPQDWASPFFLFIQNMNIPPYLESKPMNKWTTSPASIHIVTRPQPIHLSHNLLNYWGDGRLGWIQAGLKQCHDVQVQRQRLRREVAKIKYNYLGCGGTSAACWQIHILMDLNFAFLNCILNSTVCIYLILIAVNFKLYSAVCCLRFKGICIIGLYFALSTIELWTNGWIAHSAGGVHFGNNKCTYAYYNQQHFKLKSGVESSENIRSARSRNPCT